MGVEFLMRTRKTVRKTIDDHRVALATPNLFSRVPGERPRVYLGTINSDAEVEVGESLIAEARKCGAVAFRRGNHTVGTLDNPSKLVLHSIEQSGGVAHATIERVHVVSGKVDVTIC